jgi:hypothetical protein
MMAEKKNLTNKSVGYLRKWHKRVLGFKGSHEFTRMVAMQPGNGATDNTDITDRS